MSRTIDDLIDELEEAEEQIMGLVRDRNRLFEILYYFEWTDTEIKFVLDSNSDVASAIGSCGAVTAKAEDIERLSSIIDSIKRSLDVCSSSSQGPTQET